MSFRSFILYCTLCGGWAAFLGWALGRLAIGEHAALGTEVQAQGIKGMFVGMLVALALVLVDVFFDVSFRQVRRGALRVLAGLLIGTTGGLIGGVAGQFLVNWVPPAAVLLHKAFFVVGWAITGLLVGASIGAFDLAHGYVRKRDIGGAARKILKGAVGGAVGGLLGSVLSLALKALWGRILTTHQSPDEMLSPSAAGLVALGLCIGLMIGLAQVFFRQAWLKVETGFRAGREVILSRPETTIGRAESSDIGLFGDSDVDLLHARLLQTVDGYVVVDAGSRGGTLVNGQPIAEATAVRSGDLIQVGNSVLSFMEKTKRKDEG